MIGAGNVGRALGAGLGGRHDITYGVRDPEAPRFAGLPVASNADAASGADVVFVCTPWQHTEEAVKSCADLSGRVVIDCTNPLTEDLSALQIGTTTSGAEQLASWAPGARVCKAMNQIGAPMMNRPALERTPVMFVCGDDSDAKSLALGLVGQLGFDAVDVGPLTLARLLEPYALLWIHLALRCGYGTRFGFGLLAEHR